MALKNYTIGKALRVEKANDPSTAVEYLFGSGAPGGDTGEQDDAPIGSSYNRLDSPFNTYKKIADANSTADWVAMSLVAQDPETDVVVTGTVPVSTPTNIDCIKVDDFDSAEWEVTVRPTAAADDEKKEKFKVSYLHDGSASADATLVDYDVFSKLKTGPFNLTVDVVLSGAGASQEVCLELTTTEAGGITYTARRTNLG